VHQEETKTADGAAGYVKVHKIIDPNDQTIRMCIVAHPVQEVWGSWVPSSVTISRLVGGRGRLEGEEKVLPRKGKIGFMIVEGYVGIMWYGVFSVSRYYGSVDMVIDYKSHREAFFNTPRVSKITGEHTEIGVLT